MRWLCSCDCGGEIVARVDHLTGGYTNSCKCARVKWTVTSITEAFREWAQSHGGIAPSKVDAERGSGELPTWQPVRRVFGSWNAAVVAAGLTPRHVGENRNVTRGTQTRAADQRKRQMVTGGEMGAKRHGPGGGYA